MGHVDEVERIFQAPRDGAVVGRNSHDERIRRFASGAKRCNSRRVLVIWTAIKDGERTNFERFALRAARFESVKNVAESAVGAAVRADASIDPEDASWHSTSVQRRETRDERRETRDGARGRPLP